MNNVILAAAIAGSASAASAQNFSLSIVPSTTIISPSSSFTLSVYGDADVGTHLLGGAFSIDSNGDCVQSMQWTPAAWSAFNTDGGYAGGGDYNQVVFGQLVIPGIFPPAPGSENGSLIGSFFVQMDPAIGDFSINFQLVAGSPFTLETVDAVTGDTYQSSSGNLTLGSATVSVIPAPGVVSLLGMGGLMCTRRRR
ncbi:MAG: hypothetical protein JJ916_05825 [Phycisphaerales bacterium]|nr:hypothetical protein [Phycisphaerales bacterium]